MLLRDLKNLRKQWRRKRKDPRVRPELLSLNKLIREKQDAHFRKFGIPLETPIEKQSMYNQIREVIKIMGEH